MTEVFDSLWPRTVGTWGRAAEAGIGLVPAGVERLRRDGVVYRPLDEEQAASPNIMTSRRDGKWADVPLLLRLLRDMYRKEGIAFGV